MLFGEATSNNRSKALSGLNNSNNTKPTNDKDLKGPSIIEINGISILFAVFKKGALCSSYQA